MLSESNIIQDGDYAVAYEGYNNLTIFRVTKGHAFQNKNGHFKHDDMIGQEYGVTVRNPKHDGFVNILRLNPQLWTEAINVRTQILFQTDISMVCYHLDLKPGSVVIESGTGSGSLTSSMARCVAPYGHIHTFEFNADRVEKAKEDFEHNALAEYITCRHRDVCGRGFPVFPEGVDAVFLDLPTPWIAVDSAHAALRPQGRMCNFSPCIEQVQKVVKRLTELKYEDVFTIECISRGIDVSVNRMRQVDVAAVTKEYEAAFLNFNREVDSSSVVDGEGETEQPYKRVKVDDESSCIPLDKVVKLTRFKVEPLPYLARLNLLQRGHTGYLTFGRKPSSYSAPTPLTTSDETVQSEQ